MTACWWRMRTGSVTTEFSQPADAALNLSHALHTTHNVCPHFAHEARCVCPHSAHDAWCVCPHSAHDVWCVCPHSAHDAWCLSARLSSCTAVPSWAAFGSAPNVSFSFSAWRCSFCQFWYSLVYLFHFGKRQNSVIKMKLYQKGGAKPIVQ